MRGVKYNKQLSKRVSPFAQPMHNFTHQEKDSPTGSHLHLSPSSLSSPPTPSPRDLGPTFWSPPQNHAFTSFWLHKMIDFPLKSYSFDCPLERNGTFPEMSLFLEQQLGAHLGRSDQQCKSKFATIKRRVQRLKRQNKLKQDYNFVDYVLEQAALPDCPPEHAYLRAKVQHLRATDSEFMILTKSLHQLQRSCRTSEKNNNILKYLTLRGLHP